MCLRIRASVSLEKVPVSASARSSLVWAMSSPEIRRSLSPAASSVLTISASAVDSHAFSGFPERLRNPRTATDRRAFTPVPAEEEAVSRPERERRSWTT